MKTDNRTPKEHAIHLSKACANITKLMSISSLLEGHTFFDAKEYNDGGLDDFIISECERYSVEEAKVRKVLEL